MVWLGWCYELGCIKLDSERLLLCLLSVERLSCGISVTAGDTGKNTFLRQLKRLIILHDHAGLRRPPATCCIALGQLGIFI